MENLSLGQQSPVEQRLAELRLEEEEDREEREQTGVGRDPSPVVEVVVVVVMEVEEEDPRVLEVRSPDLARLPALGEMWSPVWEPVRRSAR